MIKLVLDTAIELAPQGILIADYSLTWLDATTNVSSVNMKPQGRTMTGESLRARQRRNALGRNVSLSMGFVSPPVALDPDRPRLVVWLSAVLNLLESATTRGLLRRPPHGALRMSSTVEPLIAIQWGRW
jgi:hypothetical protein